MAFWIQLLNTWIICVPDIKRLTCCNNFMMFVFVFLLNTQPTLETKFDDLFGTSAAIDPFNFNSQNGMRKDDK